MRIQKAHLIEVRYFRNVYKIYDSEILDFLGYAVQGFVHDHALSVPVVPETNNHDTVILRLDGFVNVPSRRQMRKEIRHECED